MNVIKLLLSGLTALAAMATVTVTDPTGDSVGDGTIVAPTASRYANSAIFDLQDVRLHTTGVDDADGALGAEEARSVLSVTLGAIDASDASVLGFGSLVLDVYLDSEPGGLDATLDGPGMLLPADHGWEYALRLTPDGATGYVAYAPRASATPAASGGADAATEPVAPDDADGADTKEYDTVPVVASVSGSTLTVELPWVVPESTVVYALTGVHDPFNPTGWRPLADGPSPWAYSGGEQVVPVIDILAPDQDTQARALRTGILPRPTLPVRESGVVWLALMGAGVALAITGLVLRRRVPAPARERLARERLAGARLAGGAAARPVPARGAPARPVLRTGLPPEADTVDDRAPRVRTVPLPATPLAATPRRDDDAPTWTAVAVAVDADDQAGERPAARTQEPLAGDGEEVAAVASDDVPADDATSEDVPSLTSEHQEAPTEDAGAEDAPTQSVQPEDAPAPGALGADITPPTPLTGFSAFDRFVLYEDESDDGDDDAEGFDELTRGTDGREPSD